MCRCSRTCAGTPARARLEAVRRRRVAAAGVGCDARGVKRASSVFWGVSAGAATSLAAGVAWADALPPPLFVADFLWFGPAGVVIGVLLVAGAAHIFRRLRAGGRSRGAAFLLAALAFIAADLLCYGVLLSQPRRRGPEPPMPIEAATPAAEGGAPASDG